VFAVPVFIKFGCPEVPLVDGKPDCGSNCSKWIFDHCNKETQDGSALAASVRLNFTLRFQHSLKFFDFETAEQNEWNEVVDRSSTWVEKTAEESRCDC
jgi:hypothetical protein